MKAWVATSSWVGAGSATTSHASVAKSAAPRVNATLAATSSDGSAGRGSGRMVHWASQSSQGQVREQAHGPEEEGQQQQRARHRAAEPAVVDHPGADEQVEREVVDPPGEE